MLESIDWEVYLTFLLPIILYSLMIVVAIRKEKYDCSFIHEFLRGIPIFLSFFLIFVFLYVKESILPTSLKICMFITYVFLSVIILLFWHYSKIDYRE